MSDLSYYVGNPQWNAFYRLAVKCPNGGHFSNEFQGTPGMHSGMFLWSNDTSFAMLKHGSQTPNPYIVGVPETCPSRDPSIRCITNQCTDITLNPVACTTPFSQYPGIQEKYPPKGYKRGWQQENSW